MQRRGSRSAVRSRRGVGLRAAMMAADGGAEEEAQHGRRRSGGVAGVGVERLQAQGVSGGEEDEEAAPVR